MALDVKTRESLSAVHSATFHQMSEPIFGAFRMCTLMGIWESDPLDGGDDFLSWSSIAYEATIPIDGRVYVFLKSGNSSEIEAEWSGPYLNQEIDTTSFSGRYLQVRMVLIANGCSPDLYQYATDRSPLIHELLVKGITSATSSYFFTETFDLGFTPKQIIITSESDVPDGTLLRFGVTNLDSVALADYQFVDQNILSDLHELSVTGEKIKLVIEMSGNSGAQVTVHEFGSMFSGDGSTRLN